MNTLSAGCAMTTWNSGPFLEKQLDSLRTQTRPFDEVVIVDDASSNDTVSRIESYLQKYALSSWRLIRHEANQGFVSSFQDALAACSQDVIFLCDHDDLWYPDKVERMMEHFEDYPRDLKVLASSFDLIDANDDPIESSDSPRRANHNLIRRPMIRNDLNILHFEDLAGYNIAPGCTIAVRLETVKEYLESASDLDLPHDWALCTIASLQDGLAYYDRPLIGYRQHEGNTLGLARRKTYAQRLEAARKDWQFKQALSILAMRLKASEQDQQLINLISEVFEDRYRALDNRNLFSLGLLLFSPLGQGFRMTIGMDIKTLLTGSRS